MYLICFLFVNGCYKQTSNKHITLCRWFRHITEASNAYKARETGRRNHVALPEGSSVPNINNGDPGTVPKAGSTPCLSNPPDTGSMESNRGSFQDPVEPSLKSLEDVADAVVQQGRPPRTVT